MAFRACRALLSCGMRVLSGIRPSGTLHVGNYFGMMRPSLRLQEQGEAYYFIANYHSITSVFDPEMRRQNTLNVALDFLACGLDPRKTVFFRQSDVPEVTELTWLLGTVTPMGFARAVPLVQGQGRQGHRIQLRSLCLPGVDGRRHPHLRLEYRSGRARPETARRGYSGHRH